MASFTFPHRTKPALFEDNFPELRAALPRPEQYVEFRISRKLLWALFISLAIHLCVLIWLHVRTPPVQPMASTGSQAPLDVRINPAVPLVASAPPQPVQAAPSHATARPAPRHERTIRPILTAPARQHAPHQVAQPTPSTPLPPAATDMSSYINMIRARNHTEPEPGSAPQTGTEDERMATINRNLQNSGGGGIFQITSMSDETATFIFRGWNNATWTSPSSQTFSVNASGHTDIEHAIVRKMIAIIRTRHHNTIDWDSHRLGQVVTISVKPEDDAGLEDFLLKEFFYDYGGQAPH